jgi:hypothetical protein
MLGKYCSRDTKELILMNLQAGRLGVIRVEDYTWNRRIWIIQMAGLGSGGRRGVANTEICFRQRHQHMGYCTAKLSIFISAPTNGI